MRVSDLDPGGITTTIMNIIAMTEIILRVFIIDLINK